MSQSSPQQRSILSSINIPYIVCKQVNHYNRGLQFICMGRRCMQYSKSVICFYCLQQSHHQHKEDIISIQQFIIECNQLIQARKSIMRNKNSNMQSSNNNSKQLYELQSSNNKSKQLYQLQNILLNNISKCSTKQQLTMLLQQIQRAVYLINNNNYSNNNNNNNRNNYSNYNNYKNNKKLDKVVNEQIRQIKVNNQNNYHQHKQIQGRITNKNSTQLTTPTQFYQPILSFINNTSSFINNTSSSLSSQHFSLLSPFQIRHNKSQTISTCLLQPSLNTYNQSIQTVIKIIKSIPNWIAIGVFISNNNTNYNNNNNNDFNNIYKYEQSSKNHISLLSNGWINIKGQLRQQKNMTFHTGHQIKIKLDKQKKLIIFNNLTTKNQAIVRFQPLWNQDIYLFVAMYYKNDTVSILQSAIVE